MINLRSEEHVNNDLLQFQPQVLLLEGEIARIELVLENPFDKPLRMGLSNLQLFSPISPILSSDQEVSVVRESTLLNQRDTSNLASTTEGRMKVLEEYKDVVDEEEHKVNQSILEKAQRQVAAVKLR